MEKFTPLATNFTLPPGLTGWTNSTSETLFPNFEMLDSHSLLKLLHGFVNANTCIFCPLPNKTRLRFDQNLNHVDWLKALHKVDSDLDG